VLRPADTICVRIPVKAPEGSILRTETAIDTLERVKHFSTEWIKNGHIDGDNTHNVSATISIKDDEWELVGDWMWKNREFYNGLSVLNYWGGSYLQAPFEDITEEEYNALAKHIRTIDLSQVTEEEDTESVVIRKDTTVAKKINQNERDNDTTEEAVLLSTTVNVITTGIKVDNDIGKTVTVEVKE
jgi:ribonucleoside-diphosphate reductase alpha chain